MDLPDSQASNPQQNIKRLGDEINFVKTSLAQFGFYPKHDDIIAFRGDSRSPQEIQNTGGFFRKAYNDETKIPSFRVDGGVRHMIGCSTDIIVAMGFARYNVNVQREEINAPDSGWVYAFIPPAGTYYNPTDYPHAFLADWGHELDAIYIPFDHVIGGIHVSSSEQLCIHNFLTRIPQRLHCIRGCTAPYVDDFKLKIQDIWHNDHATPTISPELKAQIKNNLNEIYESGFYPIVAGSEDSDRARHITQKYDTYFVLCAPFPYNDKDLTARLAPEPIIEYIKDIL